MNHSIYLYVSIYVCMYVYSYFIYVCVCMFAGDSGCKEHACNEGDMGSIPGSGKSLEKEMATYSRILAWRIP